MDKRRIFKKLSAFTLAVIMAMTVAPLLGDSAHGAEQADNSISRPVNSDTSYAIYHNRIEYKANSVIPSGTSLYMEYRIRGGAWKRSGYMSNPYIYYRIPGVRANTVYQTRLFYGYTDGNGDFHRGPYSNIKTYRTGVAVKPAVKKVQVKAVRVKNHKQNVWNVWGWLVTKSTVRSYSYNYRVTVTLKKAPGTRWIYINGKRFRANKTKYTFTTNRMSSYAKPKGRAYIVYAYSSHYAKYIGLSPLYKVRTKVR